LLTPLSDERKPVVPLIGEDGNAFAILGRASDGLRRAGLLEYAEEMMERATRGDYDHLLVTVLEYVREPEHEQDGVN
jgi:hypothetical protein